MTKVPYRVGKRAQLKIDGSTISLLDISSESIPAKIQELAPSNSKVLWLGNSGRPRDQLSWLKIIKSNQTYFVSVDSLKTFELCVEKNNRENTSKLFYTLSNIGFKTEIDHSLDRNRRIYNFFGLLLSLFFFCCGVSMLFLGKLILVQEEVQLTNRLVGLLFTVLFPCVFWRIITFKDKPISMHKLKR